MRVLFCLGSYMGKKISIGSTQNEGLEDVKLMLSMQRKGNGSLRPPSLLESGHSVAIS